MLGKLALFKHTILNAGFEKNNDPLDSPMLRVEFQDATTREPVTLPLFFMTWYDFDSSAAQHAVESMCIGREQFDSSQSVFSANDYLGYFEVEASDLDSVRSYFKEAFPLRPMLSDEDLSKLGERLHNKACFVGACATRPPHDHSVRRHSLKQTWMIRKSVFSHDD